MDLPAQAESPRLADILTEDVVSFAPEVLLTTVLETMERRRISCAVAVDAERRPLGILTERDVLALFAESPPPEGAQLADAMTSPVFTAAADTDYREAYAQLAERQMRHLVVVDAEGVLAGIVTEADFLLHLGEEYLVEVKTVAAAMDRDVLCLESHCSLEYALADMHARQRDCVVVLKSGSREVVGILTERDVVRLMRIGEDRDQPLETLMTPGVHAIAPEAPLQEASLRMRQLGVRRLVVLAPGGRVVGIVTRHDIVKSLQGGYVEYLHETLARMRRNEAELSDTIRENEKFYRHVIDSTIDGFFVVAADLRFFEVNDQFCELFGYTRAELIGQTPFFLVSEESRAEFEAQIARIDTTDHRRYQLVARRKDGSTFPILLNNTTHRNSTGKVVGAFGFVTDLTRIVAAQQAVAASERELRAILDNMQDTYYRTDIEGRVVRVSPSVEKLIGLSAEQVLGKPLAQFYADPAEREVFLTALQGGEGRLNGYESRLRHADGREVWVLTNAHYVRDDAGEIVGIEGTTRDISDRKRAERRIDFLAHHDVLTELPNRLLFKDRFSRSVAHGARSGLRTALLFVDLDRFKAVNDSFGHQVGDALLREAAHRLRSCVRDTDTVSRQGGDEFLVALTDIRDDEAAANIAEKVLTTLAEPFLVAGHEAVISASIGIALSPDDGNDFDDLLRKADIAMYHAKDAGRNTFRFFNERMNVDSHERMELRQRIHHGLERGEFQLYYQPLIDLTTGRIVGAEALLRWLCPTHGLIAPAHFIPVAEESGLIVPLGDWVLHEACRELKHWHAAGKSDLMMAVNLSAIQFRRGSLEDSLRAALALAGVPATSLELELTESILLHEADQALSVIQRLKALGVRLAIDDFGTGYSSLAYLKRLSVDKLKIDQSFVRDMAHDGEDAAIVRAVIQMAKSLNLAVLAEGVETAQVADDLRALACDLVQGYHFGRPVAAEEFRRMIGLQN